MARVRNPALGRSVTLYFMGDWGGANLHRVCGWLCQEFTARAGAHSRIAIWNGRGQADNVLAVGRGEVDLALATPARFATMAMTGAGMFGGERFPGLRAIGVVPQDDRILVAIDAKLGIHSFAELRSKKPPIRIALGPDDGGSFIGFAGHRVLEASRVPRSVVEEWGGRFLEFEQPLDCVNLLRDGKADAIVQEAVMTSWWRALPDSRDLAYLSLEPHVLRSLRRKFGWTAGRLPAGYHKGMTEPITTLDYSDFIILVRDDMPEDVAYLLAWCLCETRERFERHYRHIPAHLSPVTYPLKPEKMAAAPVPLHPGAERYYRDAHVLKPGRRRKP